MDMIFCLFVLKMREKGGMESQIALIFFWVIYLNMSLLLIE